MRFQTRDSHILTAIHTYGGVLSRHHIKRLFWPDASERAMGKRLSKLRAERYIDWPTQAQRNTEPGPKSVCWLGWRGAVWVAAQSGLQVDIPANEGENQLRRLEKKLRAEGMSWLREPRWSQLTHDLAVVDFRLAVEEEMSAHPALRLENWINDSVFRSDTDRVTYSYRDRSETLKRCSRGVIPDGFFIVVDDARRQEGDIRYRARLLLELDMATHPTRRFATHKLLAGVAYIRSSAYRKRFGGNAGHWLVVTTGEVRLQHLMDKAEAVLGTSSSLFSFTTLGQVLPGKVLTAPIWRRVGLSTPQPLIFK